MFGGAREGSTSPIWFLRVEFFGGGDVSVFLGGIWSWMGMWVEGMWDMGDMGVAVVDVMGDGRMDWGLFDS